MFKKLIACILLSALVISNAASMVIAAENPRKTVDVSDIANRQFRYVDYLEKHESKPQSDFDDEIVLKAKDAVVSDDLVYSIEAFNGRDDVLVWKDGTVGSISFEVNITNEGMYNISVLYNAYAGINSVERLFKVDGESLFNEVDVITFEKAWQKTDTETKYDNVGNELKSRMAVVPLWQEHILGESSGRLVDPFQIYFDAGVHTISLEAIREPLAIDSIILYAPRDQKSYKEVSADYSNTKDNKVLPKKLQGEEATMQSSSVLYPVIDRSNIYTEPYDAKVDRFNFIGGYNWRYGGQWIAWEFDIEESGYYRLAARFRQNYLMGIPAARALYVDGEIPFKEAESLLFPYDRDWQMFEFGDNDEPYLIYLEEGKHTIKLQMHLGEFAKPIEEVRTALDKLLALYSNIIMITGASPDAFRDYQLEKRIPDLQKTLYNVADILNEQERSINEISGGEMTTAHLLKRVATQLQTLAKKPSQIPSSLAYLVDNMAAISDWVQTSSEQALDIDYLYLHPEGTNPPKLNPNVFEQIGASIYKFFLSFFKDYSSVGNVYDKEAALDVWVAMGREQVDILKTMIDDNFTDNYDIPVNVNILSNENTLLFSVASGQAPDVALQLSSAIPVDYGLRNALVDLSVMPGYSDVAERFMPSAIEPFEYDGKVYGVPSSQSFPVMFYRKDILDKLNIPVPNTWDEFYDAVATLNEYNLQAVADGVFNTFLYQNDTSYFDASKTVCILDSPKGLEAFKSYTDLYTKYGLPLYYSLYNRFRSGDIPIGITDFSLYNQLSVAAPEIKGLWGMALVPGQKRDDGTINRAVVGGSNANVIMKASTKQEQAWQFLDWWTSTEIQTRFANDVEARMGVGARVATANVEAMKNMAWSRDEQEILLSQWENVVGVPVIPGSYFVGRHLENAFREVIEYKMVPRDTLTRYTEEINVEINKKMVELGLR